MSRTITLRYTTQYKGSLHRTESTTCGTKVGFETVKRKSTVKRKLTVERKLTYAVRRHDEEGPFTRHFDRHLRYVNNA
eukprot:3799569-Rhodomonas_salina.1